ncbi:efflux transporter outer membrane subunit [Silvimonas iriomotensis]|uniref:Multidrug resistance transporter n=1 Tax=Silvimonas iriomotensis TaxID=449662 RepID=A0ABQ2PDW5_9NEIS|nr:efflux transporter outer membrane subunit [Silvimonas iriomotensis]GGP23705.1 multidrug resistance transporter [Silvimonas iriomotensis]
MKQKLAFGILVLLAGCASIPDDHPTVQMRDAAAAQLSTQLKLAQEGWPAARWWTRYHDDQLNALVDAALKGSPSLAVAQSRVALAQTAVSQARAADGINVDASVRATRELTSKYGIYPPPLAGNWITDTEPMINASYDFDWWGKHKAEISAALGETAAAQADYAAAEQQLTAAVAEAYFDWQADQARIQVVEQQRDVQDRLHQIAARRVQSGLDTDAVQRSARGDVANQDSVIAQLRTSERKDREALRALVGATGDVTSIDQLKAIPLPASAGGVPTDLGLNLLSRRPDLQAARWRVEASVKRTEADKAAFYPDINISAFIGFSSISLDDFLKRGTRTMGITPGISFPIFDNGRLSAGLQGDRAQRDVIIAQYNQALVNAVQDVANQGIALQGLADQEKAMTAYLRASEAVRDNQQRRMQNGLTDQGSVLRAQLPVLMIQEQLLILKNRQLAAEIGLTHALGGGYEAPADTVAKAN